jgi:hypothetical protein
MVHEPLVAGVTRTVVACTGSVDVVLEFVPVEAEVTTTHDPTVTAETLTDTCWVKVVEPVQVTATCAVWLCT